jgi:long-chain acyl-CoA synthetase
MFDPKPRTVVELFRARVEATPDSRALCGRRGGEWHWLTWREAEARVRALAAGLLALGLAKGERAAILSSSRPEWILADLAILWAGGAVSTLYPSNTAEDCAYILADSGAKVCFVENDALAAKLRQVRDRLPQLEKIVLFEVDPIEAVPMEDGGSDPDPGTDWATSLDALEAAGAVWSGAHPGAVEASAAAIQPEDLATLIYTSGTSGPPKGVMLTHDNWVYEGELIANLGLLGPQDMNLVFLPLAHSYAKAIEVAILYTGIPSAIDGSVDNLAKNLAAIRPTVFGCVPRVLEKVYNRVVTAAREGGALKYRIFLWALDVGKRVSRVRQLGREPGGLLALQHRIAARLVYGKIKARFGGRLRFLASGGAPLSLEIIEFFHALDILILEGYGLTETSGASSANSLDRYRFGTVGPALRGTEIQLDEDGEVLIRGRHVMRGYFNLPEATAAAFTADGWFRSGDIGRLDADGFLSITDRKKDILITAGGKNVAPQNVENQLKASCPYLSQVVMLGDRRPFCVALVTLNDESCGKWARERGLAFEALSGLAALASLPVLREEIRAAIAALNDRLPPHERIRNFRILERDFSIETGELTPKMSIKRKVVEARHAAILEELYGRTMEKL